ncbi:protein XNDC1N isoform X2 [Dendropsophus ebraccatus]
MENLLQPWLICPRERSRQLRVELQLERACHIAYIDIGNSGSAFLQIDVGRSTWPPDKGYTTLLPMTTLMSPADSRAMKNRRGVRMFKEGDFLQAVAVERWDRLRVTCTQPFNKQEQFGLSFIRIRSSLCREDETPPPQDVRPSPIPPHHLREESGGDEENLEAWNHMERKLREKLQSPSSPPPPCVSRSARMLQLSAAKSRKRSHMAPRSPPIPLRGGDSGTQQEDSPSSSGSCPETLTGRRHPSQQEHRTPSGCRRLRMAETPKRRRAQTPKSERHLTARRERAGPSRAQRPPETDTNICPICAGHFPAAQLPAHAATCGESPGSQSIVLSSSDDNDDDWDDIRWRQPSTPHRPASRVPCPLCGFSFQDDEIERHASTCGE